jgi:hypothetical protein
VRERGRERAVMGIEEGEDGGEERCDGRETDTGRFVEAAVDGLISCVGDGARLREAVWSVEAISPAAVSMIEDEHGFWLAWMWSTMRGGFKKSLLLSWRCPMLSSCCRRTF